MKSGKFPPHTFSLTSSPFLQNKAILDSGTSASIVSSRWLSKFFPDAHREFSSTSERVAGVGGRQRVLGTATILLTTTDAGRPIPVTVKVIDGENPIPPLISFHDLPAPFTLSRPEGANASLKISLQDGRALHFQLHASKLFVGDCVATVEAPVRSKDQEYVFLSTSVKQALQALHEDSNHAPYDKLAHLLRAIPRTQLNRAKVAELLKNCKSCALQKDNRNTSFERVESDRPQDMVSVDLLHFKEAADNVSKGVVVAAHRRTKQVAARTFTGKKKGELLELMRSILGDGQLPLARVLRIDGEKGFTAESAEEIARMGIDEIQVTPPGVHTAAGHAEATVKRFVESMRLALADRGMQPNQWPKLVQLVVRRMND